MVYTTHKNGHEWGMVYYCYTNIRPLDLEVRNGVGALKLWVEAYQPLCSPMSLAAMLVSAPWVVPWIPWAMNKHIVIFFFSREIQHKFGGSYAVLLCCFCLAVPVL